MNLNVDKIKWLVCAGIVVSLLGIMLFLPISFFLISAGSLFFIALVMVCILRPTFCVWCILFLLFFGNRVEISSLNFWGRYLPTLGIGLFVLVMGVRYLLLAPPIKWHPMLFSLFVLFPTILLISALYNTSTFKEIALSFGIHLRYPVFFLMLMNADFKPEFYNRITRVFVAFSLLQVPVCLVQFLFGATGDSIIGTMGSNQSLAIAMLVSQCILMGYWLTTGRRSHRYVWGILLLVIPNILGYILVGLLSFPILMAFMIFRHYGYGRIWRASSILFKILLGIVFTIACAAFLSPTIQDFLGTLEPFMQTVVYMFEGWDDPELASFGSVGRFTILPLSFPLLLEEPIRLIWGFGPESTYGGTLIVAQAAYTVTKIPNSGCVCQKLADLGIWCREPQTFRALMEFGFLGALAYSAPLFFFWKKMYHTLKLRQSVYTQTIRLAFDGIGFLFIFVTVWYIGVWRMDSFCFPFWFMAAAALAHLKAGRQSAF